MTDNTEHLIDFAAYAKQLAADIDPDHEADVLLLTCMDFRFFLRIAELMKGIKYDHVILAGAALGATTIIPPDPDPVKPAWQSTFFDHLQLARDLHNVKKVIVLEHRECGAYGPKGFGVLPEHPERNHERRIHDHYVDLLKEKIPSDLYFCSFLMEVPTGDDVLTCDQLVCTE